MVGNFLNQPKSVIAKTILIITFLIVRDFHGEIQLNPMNATKDYINLDIPIVTELRKKMSNDLIEFEHVQIQGTPKDPATESVKNRITLADLVNIRWTSTDQEKTYTCVVSLDKVISKDGWYYVACTKCGKKVVEKGTKLYCTECVKYVNYPKLRFQVKMMVSDDTCCATFFIFDSEIYKITGKSAKHLLEKQDKVELENEISEEILSFEGQKRIVQIKLNDYNLKRRSKEFTVSQIFDEDLLRMHVPSDKGKDTDAKGKKWSMKLKQ